MKYIKWMIMILVCPAVVFAGEPAPARVVTASVIEKTVAETAPVTGVLYFDRLSRLSSEVSGLVESVHFREGDRVKNGDVMLRLNRDFIKNEIASVQARIDQVDVRLVKAGKELDRYETLYRQEAVTEQAYDDMALSRENLVKQNVILEKELELARLKDRKSVIRAPFDGIILEQKSDSGNWVAPGSELCLIGAEDELFIKVPVSERLLKFSKNNQRIDVKIHALGKTVVGVIEGFIPVADPRTKNISVKIRIPRMVQVALNMSAEVSVPIGEKKRMVLVPRDALNNSKGRNFVYAVKDGKAAALNVTVLSYMGNYACVADGEITAGMPVVVDGNERLRPDQAVTVINEG